MRRAAVATAVLAIGSLATAAPAGAAATISVTPSTDLVEGQTVHVSGSGFLPFAPLVGAECETAPTATPDACDLGTLSFLQADGTGSYSFDLAVRSALHTAQGLVDCTSGAGACVMGIADHRDITGTAVTAPLSFVPPGPPQSGALHVPAAPVAADEGINITATDFTPNALIETGLCAADATDANDCELPWGVLADASGTLSFFVFPSNTLSTQNLRTIDCTVDGACVYAAWDFRDFAGTLTTEPVRIAPEIPGSLTVTPSTDLHDGDQVTLSGSGWPANLYLEFYQCDGTGDGAACSNYFFAFTDEDGTLSTPYEVRSISAGGTYVNCETGPCYILAVWQRGETRVLASQQISFDTSTTAVTSQYTGDELAAVGGGATTLGISDVEVQHLGTWALAWVLAITHTGPITPAPDSGPGSLTTEWLPSEYSAMSGAAAAHGTTLPEFQKTGALFLAYVLAIS